LHPRNQEQQSGCSQQKTYAHGAGWTNVFTNRSNGDSRKCRSSGLQRDAWSQPRKGGDLWITAGLPADGNPEVRSFRKVSTCRHDSDNQPAFARQRARNIHDPTDDGRIGAETLTPQLVADHGGAGTAADVGVYERSAQRGVQAKRREEVR
jgi:hypothetical protein